jgi:hypothetical protein
LKKIDNNKINRAFISAVQVKAELFGCTQISFDFFIGLGRFQDQVHRKDAEFAKGECFVLSGERPESTKA